MTGTRRRSLPPQPRPIGAAITHRLQTLLAQVMMPWGQWSNNTGDPCLPKGIQGPRYSVNQGIRWRKKCHDHDRYDRYDRYHECATALPCRLQLLWMSLAGTG
jgi:hypothetical protein